MISGIFSQAEFLRRLFQPVQISGLFHVFCIDHRNPSKLSVLLIIDKLSCFLSLFYRRLYFIWKNQLLFYFIKSWFRLYSDSGRFFQKSELFFLLCLLSLSDLEASPDFRLYKDCILQIRNQKALRHPSLLSWNPEQP